MDNSFLDIQNLRIDGESRAARWKSLRMLLRRLAQEAHENNETLALLEREIIQLQEANLRIAEALQTLGDLANEEIQREISLTLNDTNFEIVVDAPSPESEREAPCKTEDQYTISEVLSLLADIRGIGPKKLDDIAAHLRASGRGISQSSLNFEYEGSENHGW